MTHDELPEFTKMLHEQVLDMRRKELMLEACYGAMQAFLVRKFGPDAKTEIKELFKVVYDHKILALSKQRRDLAIELDRRSNLPEDQQMGWYAPDEDGPTSP